MIQDHSLRPPRALPRGLSVANLSVNRRACQDQWRMTHMRSLKCVHDFHVPPHPRAFLSPHAAILGSSIASRCRVAGLVHSRVARVPHAPLKLLFSIFLKVFLVFFKFPLRLKTGVYSVSHIVYVCFTRKFF